ncbi:hypothetical protein KCU65_g328, partial [Aureobasidium melanogenum]
MLGPLSEEFLESLQRVFTPEIANSKLPKFRLGILPMAILAIPTSLYLLRQVPSRTVGKRCFFVHAFPFRFSSSFFVNATTREMGIRLVHKASGTGSYRGHTERTSTPATMGNSSHDPPASNHDSTDDSFALDQLPDGFDADVGPYDPDNDYFPDENMTDAEAAEEAARLRQEEIKEAKEFNKKNHGDLLPESKQKKHRVAASSSGTQSAAPSARSDRTCDRCKTLRKGCDRAVPSCGRCQARGQACVYSRGNFT